MNEITGSVKDSDAPIATTVPLATSTSTTAATIPPPSSVVTRIQLFSFHR